MKDFEFMLAKVCDESILNHTTLTGESNLVANKKFDGGRAALGQNGTPFIFNRRKASYLERLPELEQDLGMIPVNTLLDCEIVYENDEGEDRLIVQKRLATQNKSKIAIICERYPVKVIAFDIAFLKGEDLRTRPLIERAFILETLCESSDFEFIKLAEYFTDSRALWKQANKENWEGIMLKDKNAIYTGTRCNSWLKLKIRKEKVIKFTGYEVNNAGITLTSDVKVRVQCSGHQSRNVKDAIDLQGFADCEIEFQNILPSGALFQPTFKRMSGR